MKKMFSYIAALLLIALTLPARQVQAIQPLSVTPLASTSLVKDINDDPSDTSLAGLAQIGDTLFIVADDGVHGYELWKSDGTPSGTVLVKDIITGADSGFPYNLGVGNNHLFFKADDGANNGNIEVWVSDGTEADTRMLSHDGGFGEFYSYAMLGTDIIFATSDDDGILGEELYKSSPPYTSMTLIKDINSDPVGESSYPYSLTNVNGTVFFSATGTNGSTPATDLGKELWKTNGTENGTVLVKDINPGGAESNPQGFMAANNLLFFQADDGVNGVELWKSDGTESGTQMVMDIYPGDDGSVPVATPNGSYPSLQIVFNNFLYFTAIDDVHGSELWRTNGTITELVKDIYTGSESGLSNVDAPFCFTELNGMLLFGARDAANGMELWKTDGTEEGTSLFMDIHPGAGDSDPCDFVQNNGIAYFIADDGDGQELWQTDGTTTGTFRLTDMNSEIGAHNKLIYSLHVLNEKLYYFWDDGTDGAELWQAIPPEVPAIAVAATPDPSRPSQSVSVSVTLSGTTVTPTGTVEITGADVNCEITLSGGTGSCNVVFNTPGKKTITAAYSGDNNASPRGKIITHHVIAQATFNSIGVQDGWVLESSETSNKGGKINSGASTLNVGDDAANKQYRAVLSFDTTLPAGAVVTGATLRFKYAGKTGTLPFSTHGKLLVDVKKGAFSNNPALAKGDFNAGANKNALFSLGKSTGWFTKVFSAGQLTYINTSGVTQFRLRFAKDDNNDLGADLLKIHSGSAGAANRPQLIVEYYIP